MGQEFGQEREWSEARELDWFLLAEHNNAGMKEYMQDLLKLYRSHPCMYRIDDSWDGFEWMNADDADHSTFSFVRKDETGKKNLLFVTNMTPMRWENYMIPVPKAKKYKLALNSDEKKYGGWGSEVPKEITAAKKPCVNQPYSITLDLPPYTAVVYEF